MHVSLKKRESQLENADIKVSSQYITSFTAIPHKPVIKRSWKLNKPTQYMAS